MKAFKPKRRYKMTLGESQLPDLKLFALPSNKLKFFQFVIEKQNQTNPVN